MTSNRGRSKQVVVFDYGEVISPAPSQTDREDILELAGVDPDRFWSAYWRHRPGLDLASLSVAQYWHAIEADTGASWSAQRIHQLYLADFRSWLVVDQHVLQILLELKARGVRLALLSNAGPDFSSYYRSGMLGDLFERVFTSAELGVLKPNPLIFDTVVRELGVRADDVVFVDNLQPNVAAAIAVGMHAHHYTDPASLQAFLTLVTGPSSALDLPTSLQRR